MRKYILLVLAFVCVLWLVGCKSGETSVDEPPKKTSEDETSADETSADETSADETSEETSGDETPVGTSVDVLFDIAISYANWTDRSEIYTNALNTDKMTISSSVRHLPIYKFDTLEDLVQFKLNFDEDLDMNASYDEIPSFEHTTGDYSDTFFEENTLMLVYVGANSGTYRFGVNSVFCDGTSFCIHVEQVNKPELVTCDMAGWFITVAVPDSMVANCTEFDADLNNNFE